MPELPEVETIKLQLKILAGARITSSNASHFLLRYRLENTDHVQLIGMHIQEVGPQRLGRYLLIPLMPRGILMIHLGMTGVLRLDAQGISQKHDHFSLGLILNGIHTYLVYNDSRRFGGVRLMKANTLSEAKNELKLGDEPTHEIEPKRLHFLYDQKKPIKSMLMNNQLVTGIGNIYASEICYDAALSPQRLGTQLSMADYSNLSISMHNVIRNAIVNGGSTLRNYVHLDGSKGGAQQRHRVYGRAGGVCCRCCTIILALTQTGRTTFYCPQCQL